jgi:hypothetical protein
LQRLIIHFVCSLHRRQLSSQLVQWDAALQTLLKVTGVLFTSWFLIQLKDILIRDLILVRAIKSGRKELERVFTPLSSLMTWAAVLACGISVCTSLGLNLEPLLAVGGAGGIAAGFASQQVLTNIVSGGCGPGLSPLCLPALYQQLIRSLSCASACRHSLPVLPPSPSSACIINDALVITNLCKL